MKCTDYKDGVCHYDSPVCKYREDDTLREEIDHLMEEIDHLNKLLGNLLAVIHGDGGHYQGEVGTEKAAKDAEKIVCDLRAKRDALKAALQRTHNLIVSALNHGITETWRQDAEGVLVRDRHKALCAGEITEMVIPEHYKPPKGPRTPPGELPSPWQDCPCYQCQERPIETCPGSCESAAPEPGDYDCAACPKRQHCEVWAVVKVDEDYFE
jgi:hypothetical protein